MSNSPQSRAKIHQRVRRQHSSELAQDYVEAIYEIQETGIPVSVSSLQEIFGVSHVTVIRTLKRIEEQELITDTRSKKIELTAEGMRIAKTAAAKHDLLKKFFVELGVCERQADADAEGAEHHLSEETLEAIRKFLAK
ncbi:MAG: iron dependent repressor, metal binding and dimerization domain protein [Rubritalea sp.]|jgi:DtxR family manganese transport transcriptional regulator|tara:strand:+ start:1202 stop:1615 length:414 start_codon:yes stop_codon:yes gene_type:complete